MNILIIGEEANLKECQSKFKDHHSYMFANTHQEAKQRISDMDVSFDFTIERDTTQLELYRDLSKVTIFLNTAKLQLGSIFLK